MKKDVMDYVVIGLGAFGITLGVISIAMHVGNSKTLLNIEKEQEEPSAKIVVADMYIFQCPKCGYEKAEGDYSYVSRNGWERCPKCGDYREIASPRH